MSEIAKRFSLCFLTILVAVSHSSPQKLPDKTHAPESPFFFDITYKNNGRKSKYLVNVGIRVSNFSGSQCQGNVSPPPEYFSDFLQPQADYVVRFHVPDNETVIAADPPIGIKPDEAVRFTISYFPSSIEGCMSGWAADISGILIFDDGQRAYTKPERLTGRDVTKYIERRPEEAELLAALKHRDTNIRAQAISQLPKSTLDRETITFIIRSGLENTDPRIRAAAAISASKLGLKLFAENIAFLLRRRLYDLDRGVQSEMFVSLVELGQHRGPNYVVSFSQKEIRDYCEALGELEDPRTADALIAALINSKFMAFDAAEAALIKINHPDVVTKARPFLLKNINWLEHYELSDDQYFDLWKIMIAYKDVKSVEILRNLIEEERYARLIIDFLLEIYKQGFYYYKPKTETVQDPFILAARPVFEKVFAGPEAAYRNPALNVLARMALPDNIIQGYLRTGLKDPDSGIRMLSADFAATFGYRMFAVEILELLKSSQSESERKSYCQALQTLRVSCH